MKQLQRLLIVLGLLTGSTAQAQTQELTTSEAQKMYSATSRRYVSVHDPSVVYDHTQKRYYIFGSHQAWAWTSDMQNWNSIGAWWGPANNIYTDFNTNQTTSVNVGGVNKTFGNFNAQEWAAAYAGGYNIGGNLWAPAVIYNKALGKWCQYLSVNGPNFNSVIIMLTAPNINGPYTYQGPVVYSGFFNSGVAALSWKNTDVPLALGNSVTALPGRYNISQGDWAWQWPNCIDPCVFYDADGKLWMVYGSWFGGLWMLHLDESTGLRDYNYAYGSDYDQLGRNVTHDPYYGIKVHGGHWVSGEGPYIESIGQYYFLFASYGGLESKGGYQMRVFRSQNPTGPYVDSRGVSAIYSGGANNYGVNPDPRGEKLLGPYDKWGFQTVGELAQGHNSVIAAPDGRTYLIYHTRFNDGGEGHLVRVHQLFLNQDNWLVAAPFEYAGEKVTDADIASKQTFTNDELLGTYYLLVHKYSIDHANLEVVTPVKITLEANGNVTGDMQGTWRTTAGTDYFTITLDGTVYKGIVMDKQMDNQSIRAVAFSCAAASGVNVWGYKMQDKYSLAYQLNNQKLPISGGETISGHIDLDVLQKTCDNIDIQLTSSMPDIISDQGVYNPTGLTENTPVDLQLRVSSGDYFWQRTFKVTAKAETIPTEDYLSGLMAYLNFNSTPLKNIVTGETGGIVQRIGSKVSRPTLAAASPRDGNVVHTYAGEQGSESFVRISNPLHNGQADEGITVAFWTRISTDDIDGALLSFYNTTAKNQFYMTGNCNIVYSATSGDLLDINNHSTITTDYLPTGKWAFVTLVISRSGGITLYVNGLRKNTSKFTAQQNGEAISRINNFDYDAVVDHLVSCSNIYFGYGTPNGSLEADYDDFFLYNRVLTLAQIRALYSMANRVYDFTSVVTAVDQPVQTTPARTTGVYDLNGRRVEGNLEDGTLPRGLYIINGKKVLVK